MIDITARAGALASLPLFAGFDAGEIATVAERCTEREHPKDEVLWQAGDPGDEFIVVMSGELSVWRGGDSSEVVARVGPGECLGEIALLLEEPRSATVSCSRPSRLLVLAGADFQELLRGDARALTYVSQLLARRVVATTRARVRDPQVDVDRRRRRRRDTGRHPRRQCDRGDHRVADKRPRARGVVGRRREAA